MARKSLYAYSIKCSMNLYLKVICCSYYTCLPQTAPAAQTAQKKAAPGTGTGAPLVAQHLLTNTWLKTIHNINIHANNSKN